MATMNVSLPKPMKDWVNAQTESGKYSNASDYVRDLIRRDQERREKIDQLQVLITEGVESGDSELTVDEILQIAKRKAGGGSLTDGIPAEPKG